MSELENLSKQYYREIDQYDIYTKKKKQKIKNIERRLPTLFRKENKNLIRILDFIVIFGFIFNIGALILTNILVVKETPGQPFVEANIIACKVHKFTCGVQKLIPSLVILFKHLAAWAIIIALYLNQRNKIMTKQEYYSYYLPFTVCYFTILAYDFIGNFAYYIGTLIFG
jgi:hypothetical protein